LAPTKEIAKKYDQKDIDKFNEQTEGDLQNPNEINYYDLNDSFICDDEVCSDNSENEFFNITLAYGNYSEEDVLKNILRSKKLKDKKKKKEIRKKDASKLNKDDMEVEPSTGVPSGIPTVTIHSKKRKFGELENVQGTNTPDTKEILSPVHNSQIMTQEKEKNEKEAFEQEKGMKIHDSNILSITFFDETIDNIIRECMINNEIPKEQKDVINLLKKLIVHYKKVKDEESKTEIFLNKLSDLISISYSDLKLIFEFETHKVKREGIFSNVAKLINKFVVTLTENNIRNICDKTILLENEEMKEKLVTLIGKINSYVESAQTVW
jgi:hypothetical protein